MKTEKKITNGEILKKKVFQVKKQTKSDSKLIFQNFTVYLLFAQFSYVNPIWNHKGIYYPYLIINKFWGVRKKDKNCQKFQICKKKTQNFPF